MWDDDNFVGDIQNIFVEPLQIMSLMPEINGNEEPAVNEIEPEQESAIDAFEEQPVVVADKQNNIDDDER